MQLENTILVVALVFYMIDFGATLARRPRFGIYSLMIAGFLSILAYLTFSWSFMTDNFMLKAVYEQSSRSLSPLLKLSASWTGAGGSLLLWLLMMTVSSLIFRLRIRRSMDGQQTVASLVMSFFTMTVLTFALATNPFSELAIAVPDGLGLNPSLQTIFSTIHPPFVFAAYTALLLSYSLVLANTWTKKTDPHPLDERILWRSWMYLTLGISLGGFWAYQTLGWGGYWGWDPLETSALIPWLCMTGLLFAKLIDRGRNYNLFACTFAASSLMFTVYIARSAAVPSLHAYGDFVGGAAILLVAIVPIPLAYIATRRSRTAPAEGDRSTSAGALAFWSLTIIASYDLILLLCQSLGGLFGVVFSPSQQLYNYSSMPMLSVFLVVLLVKCFKEHPTFREMIIPFAFLTAIGLSPIVPFVLSLLKLPPGSILLSIGLPFVIALFGATVYRLLKLVLTSRGHFHPYPAINYFAFFGIAILLLGVFVSSSMGTSTTQIIPVGGDLSAFGLKVSIEQIVTSPSATHIFLPPYGIVPESIDSKISYTLNDAPSTPQVLFLRYYPALAQFVATPSIHSSIFGDTYIVASATQSIKQASGLAFSNGTTATPTDVGITLKTIPAVSLVWLGVAILIAATLPFIFMSKPIR